MNLSLNLTVHNKENILPDVLNGILAFTSGTYELVIILDGCTDGSQSVVEQFKNDNPHKKIILVFADNVFETKSNNIAVKNSEGDYIIIIQDDVIIQEKDWNIRLLKPFENFSDVFAVTGNTAHNWELNKYSKDLNSDIINNNRWCDILNHVHHANRHTMPRDIFAVRDSVNRAPLAINRMDLQTLGYFDEAFYPLEMDDHDLCFRMHQKLGKCVGSYWIDWYSEPQFGGTRDELGNTKSWVLEAHYKNTKLFYERHHQAIKSQKIENRILR